MSDPQPMGRSSCEEYNRAAVRGYGCVKCQTEHFECEPAFREHLMQQSKHGIRYYPLDTLRFRTPEVKS